MFLHQKQNFWRNNILVLKEISICSKWIWPWVLRDRSSCLGKTTHVWELPLITWTSMCVVKTTQVWFLPNTWDMSKCLVKTTHVCENPHMCVYFQIQGGIFCICICIWQISLKYLTSYTYLSFQMRRPKIMIWQQGQNGHYISGVWEFPHT